MTDIGKSQMAFLQQDSAAQAQNLKREHDTRIREYFQDREDIRERISDLKTLVFYIASYRIQKQQSGY